MIPMSNSVGYIYILTNPSFKEYVKIGYADDVQKRLKQLNRSECIPFAFRVYATYEVDSRLSDTKIHSIIDKLNPNLRSIETFEGKERKREFYAMSPEDAYSILEAIAEINGRQDKLKKISPLLKNKMRKMKQKKLRKNTMKGGLHLNFLCVIYSQVKKLSFLILLVLMMEKYVKC